MTTTQLVQRQLEEVEGLIDTVIEHMTDISVWVKNQRTTGNTTLPDLLLCLKEADRYHLKTKRTLDLLELSRLRLLSLGKDAITLARQLGFNNYAIKLITLEIELQMNRMKRMAGVLKDLLNTDVIGLWEHLNAQFKALQVTPPPPSDETIIHDHPDHRSCGSR